jgi:hypothetical protein
MAYLARFARALLIIVSLFYIFAFQFLTFLMLTFLQQPEATFYHITSFETWEKIKTEGFHSDSGRIFVSRVGELPGSCCHCLGAIT